MRFVQASFILTILLASLTSAQTVIPAGDVSGVWDLSGSPYLIDGEIALAAGDTLIVDPGVEVIFQGWYKFMVWGRLYADGTESDSIHFTAADTAEGWHGLRFWHAPDTSSISYCVFTYGRASGSGFDNKGGALFGLSTHLVVDHCRFKYNYASWGGAVAADGSYLELNHCSLWNNDVSAFGGAIWTNNSTLNMYRCDVCDNTGTGEGGGLKTELSDLELRNCTFNHNFASFGSNIYCSDSNVLAENTIVTNGWGGIHGGFRFWDCIVESITYCDFNNNGYSNFYASGTSMPGGIEDLVMVNAGGDSCDYYYNIYLDPVFVNPDSGNLHLYGDSPCIDAGDPQSPPDPDNTIADIGAFWYDPAFLPDEPYVSLSTEFIDFGLVDVGTTAETPLTIYNLGLTDLIITDIFSSTSYFDSDYDPADSLVVPGDSLNLTVYFAPEETIIYYCSLTILSNDEPAIVQLQGSGGESGTVIGGGDVSGTWTTTGSPYWINGEINVPYSQTLTIEAGVDVIFTGHHKFLVTGSLEAYGTENDSVRIYALDPDVGWHGIRMNNSLADIRLAYCTLMDGNADGPTGEQDSQGGALFAYGPDLFLNHCTFMNNCANWHGGAVYFWNSATIVNCDFIQNDAQYGGGIRCINADGALIESCTFKQNTSHGAGGLYIDDNSDVMVSNCLFIENTAYTWDTGAIECMDASVTLHHCTLSGNTAGHAGGLGVFWSSASVFNTVFNNNSAPAGGGAIYTWYSSLDMTNCVIEGNAEGSGIYSFYSPAAELVNSILWENNPEQIVCGNPAIVTYTDIMGGWAGAGNIDSRPLFIDEDHDDYRLQWGSPCIDTGDPAGPLDPDGTRADMGAYFFDQSKSVQIFLTPHESGIVIPSEGGTIDFTIRVTNIEPTAQTATIWCDVTIPGGGTFGPVIGPLAAMIPSEVTYDRDRDQDVPAAAPKGSYTYNAYAVVGTDTSWDCFSFVKLGSGEGDFASGWANSGESFDDLEAMSPKALPTAYVLHQNYPNPFNPSTVISYSLQEAGNVHLSVYDLTGCKVAELVDGWRDAGVHEVTFDGSNLASGIYFYTLNAGRYTARGKMVLLK